MTITCVIADDHPPVLQFLSRYPEQQRHHDHREHPGRRRGSAEDRADPADRRRARRAHAAARPGSRCCARSRRPSSPTRVILYTGYGDDALLSDALDAGVAGVIDKEAPLDDLVRAIRSSPRAARTSIRLRPPR